MGGLIQTVLESCPGIRVDLNEPGLVQKKSGLIDPHTTAEQTILIRICNLSAVSGVITVKAVHVGGYMQNRSLITLLLTICLFGFAAPLVDAQSTHCFEVDVPFQFFLGGRMLPPGKYSIERADTAKPNIVRVKNLDNGIIQSVLCQRVENETPSATAFLLFTEREGRFSLSQIWDAASLSGNQVPMDRKVRQRQHDTKSLIVEARKNTDRSNHP